MLTGGEVGKSERDGGGGQEMSTSRDSNLGLPKCNHDICCHAAHEAIGTNLKCYFELFCFVILKCLSQSLLSKRLCKISFHVSHVCVPKPQIVRKLDNMTAFVIELHQHALWYK